MIKMDKDNNTVLIKGEYDELFDEWMTLTRLMYKSAVENMPIEKANDLFIRGLYDACKAGAEDLGMEIIE